MNLLSVRFRYPDALLTLFRLPLLVGVIIGQLSAATYYVDYATGADTRTGTSTASAWKHCPGDPAATGVAGAAVLVAGDTVIFKGGVTYAFESTTGIILRWNGTASAPITYDGNSAGTWGAGRAKFTDNRSAKAITGFAANSAASHLVFKHLEFFAIGGSAILPADAGTAVAPRFGRGIAFHAGVTNTQIDGCVFRDLGYTFSTKPMNAAAIAGEGITASNCDGLEITRCSFARVAVGIELRSAMAVNALEVSNCTFADSLVWSVNLPRNPAVITNSSVVNCTETVGQAFDAPLWTGYGPGPRTHARAANAGATVTFTASAVATPNATFQWKKNGVAIAGATTASLTLSAITGSDAATYTVVATNTSGSTTSNNAVLTVITDVAPAFTVHPVSQSATALSKVTLTAAAGGTPAPSYRWYRNGVTFSSWNQPSLTLSAFTTNDVGTYVCVATNAAGVATSNSAKLTLAATTVSTMGGTATGTQIVSTSAPPASNTQTTTTSPQAPVTADAPTTPAAPTQPVANVDTQPTSPPVPSTPPSPATPEAAETESRLVNLSVRSTTGSGSDSLIVGFVVSGAEGKSLLIRGSGPALSQYGLSRPVRDPRLALFAGATAIASNDDWSAAGESAEIAEASTRVGAFALPDSGRDAALLTSVPGGVYTAQLSGKDGIDGTALVELYDAVPETTSRLVNVSARTTVSDANSPIIGFVVRGTKPKQLLVRAIGPALAPLGVENTLSDPQLEIFRESTRVGSNDNWGGTAELSSVFSRVGAYPLSNSTSKDAAAVFSAAPGVYTVVVSGVNASAGTVLVEVYEIP